MMKQRKPRLPLNLNFFSYFAFFTSISALASSETLNIEADPAKTEIVFDWNRDRCFDENIPDSPARAFRSATGQVYLYATHYKNVPLVGPTVDKVRPSCNTLFSAASSSEPEKFDTRIWLQTFYVTNGGKSIYSLGSSDYHGKWFNNCTTNKRNDRECWASAIVLASSSDGGNSFTIKTPPDHIVARSPQKFSPHAHKTIGFLTTSNVVKSGSYYYSLFNVAAHKRQQGGNCLARTDNLAEPRSWRAWDGNDYTQPLYTTPVASTDGYSCTTLPSLPFKVRSLLWHTSSQTYVAVFERTKRIRTPNRRIDVRFSYSTSKDLKEWSNPKDIITLAGPQGCPRDVVPAAYPSLLDSASMDPNFGTTGNFPYLYYTKFNLKNGCRLTLDRDLVRIPIKILSENTKTQN